MHHIIFVTSCMKNGILLPKLFWPTVRKNCLVIEENFWNSRLKSDLFTTIIIQNRKLFCPAGRPGTGQAVKIPSRPVERFWACPVVPLSRDKKVLPVPLSRKVSLSRPHYLQLNLLSGKNVRAWVSMDFTQDKFSAPIAIEKIKNKRRNKKKDK